MAKSMLALFVVAEASCKGSDNAPGPACYEGSAGALGLTELVKVNLKTVGETSGSIEFVGSGIEGFTCTDKTYTKNGQALELSDISDCLPSGVEVSKVLYCSDDDVVKVTVKDTAVPIPITATLKKTACGSDISEFSSCTGSDDPVISEPACYQGKGGALGLTENINVKVKSFANGAGTLDFTGDGITGFACNDRTLSKSGQTITFSDVSDCLPSGIVVSKVLYCSDSDSLKITVKDQTIPIPITAVASKVACPSAVEV